LISIMFASLVGIVSSTLILGTVCLIVYIVVAPIKIGTSLLLVAVLPGASLAMTSGGRSQWRGCTPLVDLDCGSL
jgi:hypothetical protein